MAKKKKHITKTSPKTTLTTTSYDVSPEKLRWRCTPEALGITSMEHAEPVKETIGQDRALRALRVGLEMKQHGHNVFVTGMSGTGRTTTITRLLQEFAQQ